MNVLLDNCALLALARWDLPEAAPSDLRTEGDASRRKAAGRTARAAD